MSMGEGRLSKKRATPGMSIMRLGDGACLRVAEPETPRAKQDPQAQIPQRAPLPTAPSNMPEGVDASLTNTAKPNAPSLAEAW